MITKHSGILLRVNVAEITAYLEPAVEADLYSRLRHYTHQESTVHRYYVKSES